MRLKVLAKCLAQGRFRAGLCWRRFWGYDFGHVLVLGVLTLLVFARVAAYPFVLFDDPHYVYENVHVATGISRLNTWWAWTALHGNVSYWHPLTWLSHQLDCELFGLRAGCHHLTSVWIHVVNASLLLVLLRQLGAPARPAFFTAAAFALHPLHVESVAWIAERKDLLYALFWLAAFIAWVRSRESAGVVGYGLSLGFFACALMSKPTAVSLPLVLLFLELRFWSPASRQTGRAGLGPPTYRLGPFFSLSAVATAATIVAQRQLGALASLQALSVADRLDGAVMGYAWYFRKGLAPMGLCVSYVRSQPYLLTEVLFGFGLLAALCWWAWRAPNRWIRLGLGWFLLTLLPSIGLVQAGPQSAADRYSYVPLAGLGLAVVGVWERWLRRFLAPRFATVCAVALLAVCAACSTQQLRYWRDSVSLFQRALELNQENWVAQLGLGMAMTEVGRFDEAVAHLNRAVALPGNAGEAQLRLAICHLRQGDTGRARAALDRAVALVPSSAEACFLLAGVLAGGSREDALQAARWADRGLSLRRDLQPFERVAVERAYAAVGRASGALAD